MTTNAVVGHGTLFQMKQSGTWQTITEQTDFGGPGLDVTMIDVTHTLSPNRAREFIPGLVDGGEFPVNGNHVADDAVLKAVFAATAPAVGASPYEFRIVWPNPAGSIWTFNGWIRGLDAPKEEDDALRLSFTFKVSGSITFPV